MLKKLSIFLFTALAFAFTSCEEDWVEPTPQNNPQEPMMSLNGLSVDFGAGLGAAAIDLNSADSIEVIKTTATPELREGQSVSYIMYAAKTADFADAKSVAVTNGKVSTTDINIIYRDFFGKTPKANDMYFRFAAYLKYAEGASVRFGGKDDYFAATEAKSVTPIPEDFTVEEAYYLIGDMNGWSMDNLIKFNHSDKNVYDDPTFTVNVQVTAGNCWKIVPQSALALEDKWSGVWGTETDQDENPSGKLVSVNPGAGKLTTTGWVRFTINMMDNTYSIEPLGDPYLYVIGTNNGWKIDNGDYKLVSPDYDNVYTGIFKMPSSCYFRFYRALGDWDSGSLGAIEDGKNVDVEFANGVYKFDPIIEDKGNWVIPEEGVYFIKADLNDNSLFINKIDPAKIYVVGNCNNWVVEDGSCALINEDANGTSFIYGGEVDMTDAGSGLSYFRFNTALSWDSQIGSVSGENENLTIVDGAATSKVVFGSGGCYVVPAGRYYVQVDLKNGTLTAVPVE